MRLFCMSSIGYDVLVGHTEMSVRAGGRLRQSPVERSNPLRSRALSFSPAALLFACALVFLMRLGGSPDAAGEWLVTRLRGKTGSSRRLIPFLCGMHYRQGRCGYRPPRMTRASPRARFDGGHRPDGEPASAAEPTLVPDMRQPPRLTPNTPIKHDAPASGEWLARTRFRAPLSGALTSSDPGAAYSESRHQRRGS